MTKKWWNEKVAYQIYPKSFYDTNGDGIGDLRGVIEKLDYLKDLGIDIIWLSPCYRSPLADQGYDISDYYDIDPRFGTMADMDELIAEAKKRDMYILMDLVVNHCSDEHEWFKKACQDPDGKYGNFFYLRDKKEGELPTNWRSYFGGSVWEDLPGTQGIGEFLGEMRDRTFKKYDAFSVGEVFNEKPEEIPDFIGDNGYFSSMFDFAETICGGSEKGWYDCRQITPDEYKACCFGTQRKIGDIGFVSNIIENHDEPRGVSRYIPEGDCCDASKKMLGGLNFMLRGIPFIYQGQELGMENVKFESIDQVDDISTLDEYKVALDAGCTQDEALKVVSRFSRDNARTPMQWTDGENAGFTTGKPWLRVNENYKKINAESQINDPDSVRSFYKKLIALRKNPEYKETVVYGALEPVWEEVHNLMAYYRKGDRTLLVVGNYQKEPQTIELAGKCKKILINNYDHAAIVGNKIELQGYQFLVLEI